MKMTKIVSQETLDALKGIGLNLYERKLYVALLSRGTSTAGQLAELVNVPRSRSYDVLESLAEKGFVVVQHAKPLKYVAITPDEALERSKNKLRRDMEIGIKRVDKFKQSIALNELKNLYSNGLKLINVADVSGSLKGRAALNQQIETMIKTARNKIDIITTENGLKDLHDSYSKLIKNAGKKGIKIRVIAPLANKEIVKGLSDLVALKDLRTKEVPYGSMYMIDGKETIMGLTDENTHNTQEVYFWTKSEHFTKNFGHSTFDMIWDNL
jgi:sugar-specific transcriptional regulator TrmB